MLIVAYVGSVCPAVTGTVIDRSTSALIPGATVHLLVKNLTQLTGADGSFSFSPSATLSLSTQQSYRQVTCNNGIISLSLASTGKSVIIDVFDASGHRVVVPLKKVLSSGDYRFDVFSVIKNGSSTNLYIARVLLDGITYSFKVFAPSVVRRARNVSNNGTDLEIAKRAAAVDSLTIAKTGYEGISMGIPSYDVALGDIAMAPLSGAQICFWTNDGSEGTLSVYLDGVLAGSLGSYFLYPTNPTWGEAGTFIKTTTVGNHTVSATSAGTTWPAATITLAPSEQLTYEFPATQWCFWTTTNVGTISISIDNLYYGVLTGYYSSQPSWNAPGTLVVSTQPGTHKLYATSPNVSWGPVSISLASGQQQFYELH